jgi:hypothetical protein
MRLSLTTLLLAVPLSLGAQEVATWDHSLSMSYFGSEASMGALSSRSTYTKADYQFDLGLPVLTYRLGALNLGGSIGYVRQALDGQADSASGLNTISLAGALFPYQPYHITFDVTRTTAPSLFGSGLNRGQSESVDWMYRGRTVQDIRVSFRHGSLDGSGMDGGFTSWVVTENQRVGRTDFRFYGDHQEADFGPNATYRSTTANASSRTPLFRDWTWTNNATLLDFQGSRMAQVGSGIVGTYGPWTSTTFLDLSYEDGHGSSTRSGGMSQALARTWGRATTFGIVGFSGGSTSSGIRNSAGNLLLGATYRLSSEWTVSGDVSGAWSRSGALSDGFSPSAGPSRAVHVGASWGGAMTDLIRHAFFYWSDLRFKQRIEEDYPPDYLPPELQKAQMRRRMEQEGSLQFSADAYYLTNGGPGNQTWYRMQGGLHFGNGLMLQTIGDLRVDNGMSDASQRFRNEHLMVFGAYQFGKLSFRANGGYSRATSSNLGDSVVGGYADQVNGKAVTYFGLGMNGTTFGVPLGGMLMRNNDALGYRTTTLFVYTAMSIRKLTFNLNFQRGWRSDGLRTSQISLQLSRWFDTIPLWGLGD